MSVQGIPPKKGTAFGSLKTTGEYRFNGHMQVEVKCNLHDNKFWTTMSRLNNGDTISCRKNPACSIPKIGTTFGELTIISEPQRKNKCTQMRVRCRHGKKFWVNLQNLKRGYTKSCYKNLACVIPERGHIFGSLTVVSTIPKHVLRRDGKRRIYIKVICEHGITRRIALDNLNSGHTQGCRLWKECGLSRSQQSHRQYLRKRIPQIDLRKLASAQQVCIICGNIRTKNRQLNSREHFIPIVRFARMKRMKLETKHILANSLLNIFGAHRKCNSSRNDMPLEAYWRLHPEYEAPAREAFSRMMGLLNPQGDKAIRFVKRLLREAGWLLRSDYPDDGVAA